MKGYNDKKHTEQINMKKFNSVLSHKKEMDENSKDMKSRQHAVFVGLVGTIFVLLCVLVWIKPDETSSISERRLLKQMPEYSKESLLSGRYMSSFEEYCLDQFPFRDVFRSMKAMTSLKLDNNGIYVVDKMIDGETSEVICDMDYPLDEDSLQYASKRFGNVYDMYLKDSNCQVYLSIVPDKNYFYGESNGHLSMDYRQLVDIMLGCNQDMTYIDIFPYLSGEDYYRTDIHWKQEKLADVTVVLLNGMKQEDMTDMCLEMRKQETAAEDLNMEKSTADVWEKKEKAQPQYQTMTVEGWFYGVYHGQAALPIEPDCLQYLTNDAIEQMNVFDYQNNKEIPVYDKGKIESDDPYEMYVGGPISLATIENPACDNRKQLIIFRDSFGSSIAPLLAQGYSKTTLIDIRYILPTMIGQYVDFQDADVLFLYSTSVLNHSETLK